MLAGCRRILLAEAIKDMRQKVGADALQWVEYCLEVDVLGFGGGAYGLCGGFNDFGDLYLAWFYEKLAGDDARHVEQIVDQSALRPRVSLNGVNGFLRLVRLKVADA